jgi:hypothetical protein
MLVLVDINYILKKDFILVRKYLLVPIFRRLSNFLKPQLQPVFTPEVIKQKQVNKGICSLLCTFTPPVMSSEGLNK